MNTHSPAAPVPPGSPTPDTVRQNQAILTLALLAAFADGRKHEDERTQIKALAQSLAADGHAPDLPRLYQDVLLQRASLEQACAQLGDDLGARQLAYEMAVCVCDADGSQSAEERAFLQRLHHALALDTPHAAQAAQAAASNTQQADTLAALPLPAAQPPENPLTHPVVHAEPGVDTPSPPDKPQSEVLLVPEAELDARIVRGAILAGALELLPQSWATMAIIPLQIRLVYRVGQAYGHDLDQGHIKEFIATAGVGLTSQYLEQFGRKLVGGLLGKVAGGLGRGLGGAATGAAFSFATTYALGHLAKRHYASGRQMTTAALKDTFTRLKDRALQLQGQYTPQIQQQARSLDAGSVIGLVKGI